MASPLPTSRGLLARAGPDRPPAPRHAALRGSSPPAPDSRAPEWFLAGLFLLVPLVISDWTHDLEALKRFALHGGTAFLALLVGFTRGFALTRSTAVDAWVGGLFLAHLLSAATTEHPFPAGAAIREWTYLVLLYAVLRSLPLERRTLSLLGWIWSLGALAVSLIAILQVIQGSDLRFGVPWGSRATGTFLHPSFLGAFLAASLPISLMSALRSRRTARLLALVGVLFILAALALSLSRAAWVATVLALVVVRQAVGKRRDCPHFPGTENGDSPSSSSRSLLLIATGLGTALAVALFVLVAPPSRLDRERLVPLASASDRGRLAIWSSTLRMALDKPWTGHGPGSFGPVIGRFSGRYLDDLQARENKRPLQAHSEPLQIFCETGVLGLITWIGLVLAAGRRLWQRCRERHTGPTRPGPAARKRSVAGPGPPPEEDRWQAPAHLASFVALSAGALVGLDMRFPTSRLLFWYLVALAGTPEVPSGRLETGPEVLPTSVTSTEPSGGGGDSAPSPHLSRPRTVALPGKAVATLLACWLTLAPLGDLAADRFERLGTQSHASGRLEQAERELGRALALRPQDREAAFLLARNAVLQGRLDLAHQRFQEAEQRDPYNVPLIFNHALACARRGHVEEAARLLATVNRINPLFLPRMNERDEAGPRRRGRR